MKNTSYTTLQKKYAGKLVVVLEKQEKVVASGETVKELEEILKKKNINPADCVFLGPIEHYKQISVY
jgi:hypoxanthine-guanine phosphoribosyltransferase